MIQDNTYKITLIGDSGVGKTSILCQYSDHIFNTSYITTVGIDFKVKSIKLKDRDVKLQIWDTAGQERYLALTLSFYKEAMGIILVYDITQRETFENLNTWLHLTDRYCLPNVSKIVVGNKCDMIKDRRVQYDEGLQLAKKFNIDFIETSAKENTNIEEMFKILVEKICEKSIFEIQESIKVKKDSKKKTKCCKLL